MKISIITTVYKAEKDLPRLLDSMMAQKSPELEFFLIDNGSPDKCGAICEEYAKKDSRFKVYTLQDNIGYIRARNLGIQECDADYIGFCDSDDFLEPEGYDKAIERIKETQCDLYITSYRTVFNACIEENVIPYDVGLYEGEQVQDRILPQAFGRISGKPQLHGFAWKQIFRRNLILENRISYIVELQPYEDQIFNIDAIKKCERVYVDNNVIYNYIVNGQSITAKIAADFDVKAEWDRVFRLFTEKKMRATNDVQAEAYCNQALLSIYSLVVSMVKMKSASIGKQVELFKKIADEKMTLEIVQKASSDNGKGANYIAVCLKKQQYYKMFAITKLGLVMKQVLRFERIHI